MFSHVEVSTACNSTIQYSSAPKLCYYLYSLASVSRLIVPPMVSTNALGGLSTKAMLGYNPTVNRAVTNFALLAFLFTLLCIY